MGEPVITGSEFVRLPAMRSAAWIVLLLVLQHAVAFGQTADKRVSPKVQEMFLIQQAEKGDKHAQSEITRRAEQGDPKAEYALGDNYEHGFWVAIDHAEAIRWYRKAAEKGDPTARQTMGQMYFDGKGVKQDFAEAARWFGCPKPSEAILSSCQQIAYEDLPQRARDLLAKTKCEVRSGSNYDYGSVVDLDGNKSPAYEFCCSESPHGPCGAVLIGKIGNEWRELSPKEGLRGFYGACNGLIVLESQHNGFHDICLADECSTPGTNQCVTPAIWQFSSGRYHSVGIAPVKTKQ